MLNQEATLRVDVDLQWSAWEWIDMLTAINEIYSDFAVIIIMDKLTYGLNIGRPEFQTSSFAIQNRTETLKNIVLSNNSISGDFIEYDDFTLEKRLKIPISSLSLSAIQYGSPGKIDFLGLGRAAEAVQKLVSDIFAFVHNKPKREKERLENLELAIKIAQENGVPEDEVKDMVRHTLRRSGYRIAKYVERKQLPKPPSLIPLQLPEKK